MRQMGSVVIVDLADGIRDLDDSVLRDQLTSLLQDGQRNILLNLEDVPLVDSASLSEIVIAQHLAEIQGGALKLLHPSGKLIALIHMSRLSGLFELFIDESEALSSFDLNFPAYGATVITQPALA
jgi:anti-sigma B factor antagonist